MRLRLSAAFVLGLLLFPMLLLSASRAAEAQKVNFTAQVGPADARAGEGAQVVLKATIPAGFHMYSLTQNPGGGVALSLKLAGATISQSGKPVGSAFKKVPEPVLSVTLEEYEGTATFVIPVAIKAGATGEQKATVTVKYQICDANKCLPPATVDVPVTFKVAAGAVRPTRKQPVTTLPSVNKSARVVPAYSGKMILVGGPPDAPPAPSQSAGTRNAEPAQSQGLLPFLLAAIGAGFTSLLTPCVFPMIPITVSFFTKQKRASVKNSGNDTEDEQKRPVSGIKGALAYCLGIIGTFTGLGLLVTVLFGATGIQSLAANPWINIALGVLFVVLAANLMGAFEILLPSWLINRAQGGQAAGGIVAPLLMGLTFTLTSFTCTSPFVGTVLLSAAHGQYFYPVVGMLGFSTAFALPFFLLALFPQALAKLPRSGSWLVTVKAFMGFLELAAALKFFSSADLTWGTGLLTREIFLAVWAGICVVAGLYLLTWLRLPSDEGRIKVGWFRRIMGVLTIAGGVACLAGIAGRSMGDLEAFVPPTPYPYKNKAVPKTQDFTDGTPEHPLKSFAEAVKRAKETNRPIFIDFTGYSCVNCRLMEKTTLIDPQVLTELKKYIYVELYTDRGDDENKANAKLEQDLVQTTALPVYVAVKPDGLTVVAKSEGYTRDVNEYLAFLRKGLGETVTASK